MGVGALGDCDGCVARVLGGKVQIQQVVINLVRNAVEAMANAPERQIWVCTRKEEDGMIRVTVADTGPGGAEHVAQQLFTAFVTTKSEGMGLGLSICRT